MKTQNGFTLLENKEDVRKWLNSQRVTRTIAKCGGKKKAVVEENKRLKMRTNKISIMH